MGYQMKLAAHEPEEFERLVTDYYEANKQEHEDQQRSRFLKLILVQVSVAIIWTAVAYGIQALTVTWYPLIRKKQEVEMILDVSAILVTIISVIYGKHELRRESTESRTMSDLIVFLILTGIYEKAEHIWIDATQNLAVIACENGSSQPTVVSLAAFRINRYQFGEVEDAPLIVADLTTRGMILDICGNETAPELTTYLRQKGISWRDLARQKKKLLQDAPKLAEKFRHMQTG